MSLDQIVNVTEFELKIEVPKVFVVGIPLRKSKKLS